MNNHSKNWKSVLSYLLMFAILIGFVVYFTNQQNTVDANYSDIVAMFQNDEISEFTIDLSSGTLQYKTFTNGDKVYNYSVASPSLFLDDVMDYVRDYNESNPQTPISYDYKKGSSGSWVVSLLPSVLTAALLIGVSIFLFKRMNTMMNNENNRTFGFGKIKAKNVVDDENRKTTFKDVAGCDEEKAELEELVEFLKDPERFTKLGARIPKGVLLVGPPGTGKTLLARAVAGEAGAPFLSISGSDFVEMYVGVGASRVRDLFDKAKEKSPSIIFIDEIDAVGRHRGAGMGNGNDEREQTLNQLLIEMDGFGTNEGVIIIAATNRPDVLDPALLRPGRFDRRVAVGKPDTNGREEILKVHSKNKPLAPDVDLKDVAKNTTGFVGADLENLMNEAALLAAKRKLKAITMAEINESMVKVFMGAEKKSHKYSEKALKLTAFHEAGHAVVSYYLDNHDPVEEVSIIPRGLGAGGYTMYQPQEENYSSKNEMLSLLVSMLGGRVAEALTLDDISTGASNDISRATQIARDMVTKYGMSDNLGPVNYEGDDQEVFIGRDYGHVKGYSEETAAKIDNEVHRIITDAYNKTENILKTHNDKLELVANTLIEREKINKDEFVSLMENGFIEDKPQQIIAEEPVETDEKAQTKSNDE